ncbi:MAG: response regulator, partial [Bacteroidales bacterium]|nr:response regulator [Bacteroidales bacterium]
MEKSNLKILAIDDSEDNLISLKAILSDLLPEARVITTSNGRKGIALATVENPDVILLDIVMPEFDGFEVCQHLKEDENLRSIPVVFLTALKTNRESQIKALEVGAEAFLAKPIEEMHLMAIIRTMVKVKEANEMRRKEQERLSNLIQTRTSELHKESAQRSRMEENLAETNEKLRKSQIALLNILEDLKRQNRARLESEKKYRLLFTQMSEGFALHEVIRDKKGIPVDYLFLEVNNAFEELTGLNASGLVGKSVLDVMPGIEERWITTYGEVALTGKPVTFTQYSGELSKWYHVSAFSPEKGKFATIFTDVTRQMEVEEALKESENKFRGITEQIQDVIYMTDKAGRIVYISPASLEVFGYSKDEMIGKPFTGFLEKSQIPLALKKFRF